MQADDQNTRPQQPFWHISRNFCLRHQGKKPSSPVAVDNSAGAIIHILHPVVEASPSDVNTITVAMPSPPPGAQGKHNRT